MRNSEGCRVFLRCLLKLVNFLLAFVGAALLLYSIWALYTLSSSSGTEIPPPPRGDTRISLKSVSYGSGQTDLKLAKPFGLHQDETKLNSKVDFNLGTWNLPSAWFVYLLMGLGVAICLITLVGHVAAETSNGCCLTFYTLFVVLLILLQGSFVAYVYFKEDWYENIPADSTGLFDIIKVFVEKNFDFCKWLGLGIIIIEALAVLLAISVRATAPSSQQVAYNSDNEYTPPRSSIRRPLLVNRQASNASMQNAGTVEGWPSQAGTWSIKMREKYGVDARTSS